MSKERSLYASDKTLVCQDCNQEFVFSASEQQFYADRQFSEPRPMICSDSTRGTFRIFVPSRGAV